MTADGTLGGTGSAALSQTHDALLLDLDGVVYRAHEPVEHAIETIEHYTAAGMPVRYVTNNASRSRAAVADQLRELGLSAESDEVVSSAQAVAGLMAGDLAPGTAVLVVGSDALRDEIRTAGLRVVESYADRPAAVVQGMERTLTWEQLSEGARVIQDGAQWYASNTDMTLPVDWGMAPGNGTLVAAIAAATGQRPTVAGKPEPAIMATVLGGLQSKSPLVVGDRLDTDIACARRSNIASLWVATGVDDLATVASAPLELRPSYVAGDLRALSRPQADVAIAGAGPGGSVVARCAGWTADPGSGALTGPDPTGNADGAGADRAGEPESPMRVIVAACWAYADAGADGAAVARAADRLIGIWHDGTRTP